MRHLTFMLLIAMLSALVSCGNDSPTPPDKPIEPPTSDTIIPETPKDSIPSEYFGWERMRRDTVPVGVEGGTSFYYTTVDIFDEEGNNLLDANNPDNVRDNDFYCIHKNKIYRKGDKLPFISDVEIGYSIAVPYSAENTPTPFLVLGEKLGASGDNECMFYWPEKNYRMHIRVYHVSERVAIPGYAERYPGSNGFGTVTTCGTFYNGHLNAGKLILHKDGTVEGPELK